jgi:hypothetical protein
MKVFWDFTPSGFVNMYTSVLEKHAPIILMVEVCPKMEVADS